MTFNFTINSFNKPSIYLISPPNIDIKKFPFLLSNILDTGLVKIFQLRLKNYKDDELLKITNLLFKICINKKVIFILNDRPDLAKKVNVDGVHIGKNDLSIKKARTILGNNKIIGSSCYNSNNLSIKSQRSGANYIAFGSFFKTNTKINTTKIVIANFKNIRKNINIPFVGIGGLNRFNIKKLMLLQPNFLAFSSTIWQNKNSPIVEIKRVKNVLDNF